MREGAWLTAAILLMLLGLFLGQGLIFTLSIVLLLAAGLARLWNRYWAVGLVYRRVVEPRRAFVGEEIDLTTEIVNRKLLPLPWLGIIDEFPDDLELVGIDRSPSVRPRRHELITLLSLRWYERVRRHYKIKCIARGLFSLGPVQLRSGDVFGLTMKEQQLPAGDPILVYPKIVPVTAFGLPSVHPFGDQRAVQSMFEDPMRTIGVRPYTPGDSPRRVHWKATARTRELQSRLYESTTTLRLLVFLNVNTLGQQWWWQGYDPEALELSVTIAGSVAYWGIEHGFQSGLYANGGQRFGEQKVKIPPGRDPSQIVRILETLARLMPVATNSLEDLLRAESGSLPWGSTIVLVTVFLSDETLRILSGWRAAGHRVVVLLVGDGVLAAASSQSNQPAFVGASSRPTYGSLPVGPVPGDADSQWRRPGTTTTGSVTRVASPVAAGDPPVIGGLGRDSGWRTAGYGIQVHRVKVRWSELRDLQLD